MCFNIHWIYQICPPDAQMNLKWSTNTYIWFHQVIDTVRHKFQIELFCFYAVNKVYLLRLKKQIKVIFYIHNWYCLNFDRTKKAYWRFSITTWKFGVWSNFFYSEQNEYFCMNGSCQKVWCMSVKKVPYITPWPLLHMAWNRLDRLLFLKKSMDNNPKQHEPSYWELSFSCYCNSTTLPSSTSICWQYSANTVPDETYGNLTNWFHAMRSGGHGAS